MSTVPLTEVRDRLSEVIETAATSGEEFVVTRNGRPTAVIISYEDYESLIETVNILSDPDTMNAIAEAETDMESGNFEEA